MFCPTLLISHILPQSFSFDDDDDDNTGDDAVDDKCYHTIDNDRINLCTATIPILQILPDMLHPETRTTCWIDPKCTATNINANPRILQLI